MADSAALSLDNPIAISFRTLSEALLAAPAHKPFVTMWNSEDDVHTVTFGQFVELALAQAGMFQAEGVGVGDTVILILPQGIPLMAAFAGAMLLGAVPTILAYPNFKVDPAKYRMGLAGVSANLKARVLVLDNAFPDELLQHVTIINNAKIVRSSDGCFCSAGFISSQTLAPDRLALIQHSAGTTGLQKGVALTHAAVLRQLTRLAPALRIQAEDCIYSWLPLYHDMGLIACFILPMVCHLPIVMQSPTDWVMQPRTMLQLISQYRCSLTWVPNFALQFLARRVRPEDCANLDLSCLRAVVNCSEPVRASSMDEFLSAFAKWGVQPDVLQSSYAMAETVFAVTQSGMRDQERPCRIWVDGERLATAKMAVPAPQGSFGAICLVSSGQCLLGSEIRIVSADGRELPPGAIGEILIRSDSLFAGYYNRPDLSSRALQDGWYCSGDLGFSLDREVYVLGRKKDLIIVAGKNIYPEDVEGIVSSHPAIHDGRAVALGIYSQDLGTEEIVVVAEVESEEEFHRAPAIEQAIRSSIAAELAVAVRAVYLKPPKWIVKSTAGKPARSSTREKLFAEYPELRPNLPEQRLYEPASATND